MRYILFLLLAFTAARLPGQSYGNAQYAKDKPVAAQDWVSGNKTFSVSSDVILYVMPDGWVLELKGTEEAASLDLARAKIQKHVDSFMKKLIALGIAADEITVTNSGQERVSGWKVDAKGNSTYGVTGYTVSKNILMRYTDAGLYATIISEGTAENFDQVVKNYCTVGDEQSAYGELYRQAMEVLIDKQNEYAAFYKATVLPGAAAKNEKYNVMTPTPGTYFQPGTQHTSVGNYDRVIGSEYGTAAVRYTIHLDYTFTLEKNKQSSQYIYIKSK